MRNLYRYVPGKIDAWIAERKALAAAGEGVAEMDSS
jgi:hypothetical protein